ncbi:putative lipoprotein [Nautilia profundicola AmH]|uniref:Lipoprotein n=1 Tax=Nautilia profundicola (strain ATCC BAA-1463 / DSM 18972 / AmH) TaxID=598659 RepID=B9L810_NAUPA|nr:CAP domain-containing protein [Nautilia profundicola]ACM93721.1 putative lipoprotein [Nautilia profundicola AmH]
MKKLFMFFIALLSFWGCGGGSSESVIEDNTSSDTYLYELDYLNFLRNKAGMISLKANNNLIIAAENHAYYLYVNNATGHEEEEGKKGFTGQWPSDRVVYAGFLSKDVSENVSVGQENYMDSIDNLFSAIYHRFGFLNTTIDLIGIGIESKDYVYDMGNSILNTLCSHQNDVNGAYYLNVCADDDIVIDADDYNDAKNNFRKQNPDIIIWPYNNAIDMLPVFYNETPDPLPDYNVSGYPISIQFNEYYFNEDNITLKTFKLYDQNGNEVTNTRLLDKNNDPNDKFDEYEFALFPLERLEWNETYNVNAVYEYNGNDYNLSWSFKTKELPYPYFRITTDDETIYVDSNKTFAYYFVPDDGNDLIKSYGYTYPAGDKVESGFIDYNTLWIRVIGKSGDEFNFDFDNGDKLKLIIK